MTLFPRLMIDTTDFVERDRDLVLANDVGLQKLSLCKTGLYNIKLGNTIVHQGYREIHNSPLPGAHFPPANVITDDIVYEKVGNQIGYNSGAIYDVTKR